MGIFDNTGDVLIKNDAVLDYEYIPDILPFRDVEQKFIASCIKPLLQGMRGRNLFIHGSPGIGKTVATKYVLKDLEDETDRVKSFFVNCWENNTSYKILVDICEQAGYRFTQNKKTIELFKVVEDILKEESGVFVFDEIDKVEDLDFLYHILESNMKKSVILITNFRSWLVNLDNRIRSRLMPEVNEFKKYSLSETRDILKERIKHGFEEGVWEASSFNKVVNKCHELGDIRAGLFLLREAAFNAEGKEVISVEDVEKVFSKLEDFTLKSSSLLDDTSKKILELIKKYKGGKIGHLFNEYVSSGGVGSYKTFQRKINNLEEGGFIKTKKSSGSGGNTTFIEFLIK